MNQYLSENRIWLHSTPRIGVLDEKSILIIDGESEHQARLVVSYENADNPDSEKCTLSVQQAFEDEPLWDTPLPDTMPQPAQQHFRNQYFSQAAVDLIRDAIDEQHGELVLVIPQEDTQ